ncbi:MAG: hypothetical protein ACTHL1_06150 [Burkholderiaceae bacterium]
MNTRQSNDLEYDGDHSDPRDEKLNPRRTDMVKGDWKHIKDTGLPPGIHEQDLFDPNKDRPRDMPSGDHS